MQQDKDVIEIDILELIRYLLRRWYAFVLATLATAAAGISVCFFLITPKCESTTKIIILNQQDGGALTYSDMQLASQLTKDYEELIVSRDVLEAVIRSCHLEDDYDAFLERITVENVTDTRIISITVEDPSPAAARQIANSIRETAAEHIRSVTDVEAVNVVEEANLPEEPASPSLLLWTVLSAVVGFAAVFLVLTVCFLTDDTIRSAEDVERYLGLSTLALIPEIEESPQGKGASRRKRDRKTKKGSGTGKKNPPAQKKG